MNIFISSSGDRTGSIVGFAQATHRHSVNVALSIALLVLIVAMLAAIALDARRQRASDQRSIRTNTESPSPNDSTQT